MPGLPALRAYGRATIRHADDRFVIVGIGLPMLVAGRGSYDDARDTAALASSSMITHIARVHGGLAAVRAFLDSRPMTTYDALTDEGRVLRREEAVEAVLESV